MATQIKREFPNLDDSLHNSFLKVLKIHDGNSFPNDGIPNQGMITMRKEKQNKVLQELKEVKDKTDDTCQSLLYKQRKSISKKEEMCTDIVKYFASLREKVNKYLYKEEQRYLEELNDQYSEKESELDEILSWCRSLQKTMEHDAHVVEHVDFSGKIGEEKGRSLDSAFDDVIQKLHTCDRAISKVKHPFNLKRFERNEEAETKMLSLKFGSWEGDSDEGNGEMLQVNQESTAPQTDQEPLRYAELQESFQTRLNDDNRNPVIGAIAWVRDRLLTVDRYNRKLKLVHESGAILTAMVFQGGDPWDITTGEQSPGVTYAYTTVPNDKQILIIRVLDSDSLQLGGRIPTATGYCSICFDKNKTNLICGCCSPFGAPRVDILSTNGTVITSCALDPAGKPLFSFPRSIDVFGDVIIVCDWNKNRLMFLRNDGFILGTYRGTQDTPLRDPMGTALDGRGHVMVADCKSRLIHIVKVGGGLVGRLDVGVPLTGPREISTNMEGVAKLAVSHGGSLVEIFNLLKENPVASAPPYYDDYYDEYDSDPPPYEEADQGDRRSQGKEITMV